MKNKPIILALLISFSLKTLFMSCQALIKGLLSSKHHSSLDSTWFNLHLPLKIHFQNTSPFKIRDLHLYSLNPFLSLPTSISYMTYSLPIPLIPPSSLILFLPVIFYMRIIRWSYLSSLLYIFNLKVSSVI